MRRDALYKYTRLCHVMSILNNGLFASPIYSLNDPYEVIGIDESTDLRVVCLSRSRNQKLMWSHYANGHRGCSIKIIPPERYGEEDCYLRRVKYSGKIKNRENLTGKHLAELLFVKDKKWERELEVRAVYSGGDENEEIWKRYRRSVFLKVNIAQIDFGCFSHLDNNYLDALIAIRDYNANHRKKIKVRKYMMSDKKFEFVVDHSFNYIDEIARIINTENL